MVDTPTVSVVMAVRDEAQHIEATIASILAQEGIGPVEIVIAEGGSSDATPQILARLGTKIDGLLVVGNPSGRTPAGLNAAIAACSGEVIVRCDGHSVLPPGYIARAVETLVATGAGNVGGVQRAVGVGAMQRAIAIAMTTPLGVGDARFHRGGEPGPTDTVYLGVFRRSVLAEVGAFDESLVRNQDYELNHRIRMAGHAVWFDPQLEVIYRPRGSLRALASQYFQYGGWKRVMVRRNPGSIRWRQLVPPAFVLALVASILLLAFGSALGWVVPAVYATAVVAVSVFEFAKTRDAAVAALVVVLPTMHVMWGIGFLLGRSDADPPQVGTVDG